MKAYLIMFSLLIASITLQAQSAPAPVKWNFEIEKINERKYKFTATGTVKKGWYVYSPFTDPDGPVPTSINFADGITIKGKVKEECDVIKGHDDLFDMTVAKIKGQAVFTQVIELHPELTEITGQLRYMSCDNSRCLPPTIEEFEFKL